MLATSLGRSLPHALFEAGRTAPDELQPAFAAAEREWLISTDFARTIGVLEEQLADATADAVCETLLIAHELGGSDVDRRLGDLAEDRREDVRYRRDARAQQAGCAVRPPLRTDRAAGHGPRGNVRGQWTGGLRHLVRSTRRRRRAGHGRGVLALGRPIDAFARRGSSVRRAVIRLVALVATGWLGAALLLGQLPWFRRVSLAQRLAPYLPGPKGREAVRGGVVLSTRALLAPIAQSIGSRVAHLFGVSEELALRLERIHSPIGIGEWRLRQLAWTMASFIAAALFVAADSAADVGRAALPRWGSATRVPAPRTPRRVRVGELATAGVPGVAGGFRAAGNVAVGGLLGRRRARPVVATKPRRVCCRPRPCV